MIPIPTNAIVVRSEFSDILQIKKKIKINISIKQ